MIPRLDHTAAPTATLSADELAELQTMGNNIALQLVNFGPIVFAVRAAQLSGALMQNMLLLGVDDATAIAAADAALGFAQARIEVLRGLSVPQHASRA